MHTKNRDRGLADLLRMMSPRRKRQLSFLLILMLIGAAAELISIGAVLPFLRLIVAPDTVLNEPRLAGLRAVAGWRTASDLILPAALLLIGTAVTAAAVRLLLTWASQRFIYRLSYDMDVEVFRRTLHQPYVVYVNRNSSDVLAGFEKINNVTTYMLLPVMLGITSTVIAIFIIALLFFIDPFTASIAALSMGLLYVGISLTSRRSLRLISESWARLVNARTKAVQEGLGGLRDIILDRSQLVHRRRFERLDDEFRDLGARASIISAAPRFIVEGAGVVLIGLLALYFNGRPGGVLAAVPVLGALALGAQRLMPLLQTIYQAWTAYAASRGALADVLALLEGPVAPVAADVDADATPVFRREISLVHLGFRYGDGTAALTDVSLTIRRGERVGLIGQTGSGKSTLVDVLMGLLTVDTGAILLDGVAMSPENVQRWQAQIAHVPQTIFLADSSIAANIAFGTEEREVDMSRVEDAARRADIHQFIAELPDGYATTVGERGVRLSGGQRQRIGIARALYKRADVLVLDEATSALDDQTEASIMEAVKNLDRDLTIVMIAHRLSTLRACDTIYRLAGGRVVESGDYATVVGHAPSAAKAGTLR